LSLGRPRKEHPVDRIPASERTREKLKILMFGSEVEEGRSELVRLAARLIIAEALEVEARDALGRDYYARGAESSQDFDTLGRTSAKGDPPRSRSERARVRSRRDSVALMHRMRRTAFRVRRDKAAFSSGCKPRPATAPAGSNRGRHGGDEMSEAPG
jgi:hypothetical protein